MKTLAYLPLLYGKDYLAYSIMSYYDDVDQILICYSPKPSHGHPSNMTCPDSEQELIDICANIDHDNKIIWHKGDWQQENQQRNFAHDYARSRGFDLLFNADFDEIWRPGYLPELLKLTYERKASKCLIWMRHLWRSFNWICDDQMRQERIYYLGADKGDLIYAPQPENQVFHFGYARTLADVQYKISCHGHSSEWLQSKQDWFESKYKPFPPTGDATHPACAGVWIPKPFDKTELPDFMKLHPYYNFDVI